MGLQNWTFDVVFRAENCQDGPGIRARTTARFEYRWAELEFFVPSYWKDGIDGREDTIVHELGHCLVDPLNVDKDAVKMLEMVVTDLAAALLRANREKK